MNNYFHRKESNEINSNEENTEINGEMESNSFVSCPVEFT